MRRGPLYMIAAGLMFSLMITLVKTTRDDLGTIEVALWRALAALPFTWLLIRKTGYRVVNVKLLALRCVLGLAAVMGFFSAAKGLLIADLSLLGQLQPLAVALLAPLALGAQERPSPLIWLLLVIGLVGAALILAPSLAVGSIYGLYAVAGALLSAGAHVCVRGLMRTDDPAAVVFWFHLSLAVACPVLLAGDVLIGGSSTVAMPPGHLIPALLGIGLTATIGQALMTRAYAEDRAPTVAAARYSGVLWAVIIDLVVFAALPTWNVVIGGALIVAAGLWLVLTPDRAPSTAESS